MRKEAIVVTPEQPDPAFAKDVREGLSRPEKSIPPKWLYDDRGSKLFEQITKLPEYYLTERERAIFQDHAGDIVGACRSPVNLVELGAGSAEKTSILIDAIVDDQGSTTFWPIDISQEALDMAQARYAGNDAITVRPVQGTFVEGLQSTADPSGTSRLVAFIGSSIGNLPLDEQRELLTGIRQTMTADDRLLLGTDLVKDEELLLPAYDDAQGVTPRFTLNLFRRINRELGGGFDVDALEHEAVFDPEANAVRIYAKSLQEQTVPIDALDATYHLAEGERIHVEDSHKYTPEKLETLLEAARLDPIATYTDPDDWFAVHLLERRDEEAAT